MTALTVGITTAREPVCKRGLAVNIAASLARDSSRTLRVCVIDADPLNLDVTTRLAVRGPLLEDFAAGGPDWSALGSVHEPPLWVLPSAGAGVGLTHRAFGPALAHLRESFDVIVCDLVGGAGAPGMPGASAPGMPGAGWLDSLDWLLVAATPDAEPVADAARFVERFRSAQDQGDIAGSIGVGVVTSGDECSIEIEPGTVSSVLGCPVLGSVPQLWGRAAPNLGFGAALGIAELDEAVDALYERLLTVRAGFSFSRAS